MYVHSQRCPVRNRSSSLLCGRGTISRASSRALRALSAVRAYIRCHARDSRLRSGVGLRVGAPRGRQRREGGVGSEKDLNSLRVLQYNKKLNTYHYDTQITPVGKQFNKLKIPLTSTYVINNLSRY